METSTVIYCLSIGAVLGLLLIKMAEHFPLFVAWFRPCLMSLASIPIVLIGYFVYFRGGQTQAEIIFGCQLIVSGGVLDIIDGKVARKVDEIIAQAFSSKDKIEAARKGGYFSKFLADIREQAEKEGVTHVRAGWWRIPVQVPKTFWGQLFYMGTTEAGEVIDSTADKGKSSPIFVHMVILCLYAINYSDPFFILPYLFVCFISVIVLTDTFGALIRFFNIVPLKQKAATCVGKRKTALQWVWFGFFGFFGGVWLIEKEWFYLFLILLLLVYVTYLTVESVRSKIATK